MNKLITFFAFALAGLGLASAAHATSLVVAPAPQKAVLVTGASTGIGRYITELLAANGYFVYAGARKAADLAELDAIKNVASVRLDVTKPDEIAAAVKQITEAGRGLYGIVNNAGVAIVGPAIEVPASELAFQLDVNVMGPYRVTQAFAPLVIEAKGRIVNISSISGILSGGLFSHYSMSKHAVEAYTDSLAAEMARFGVGVSAVEPGNYNSEIGDSLKRRMEQVGYKIEDSLYAAELTAMSTRLASRDRFKAPDDVALAVQDALGAERPKRRYLVVPDQREAEITIRKQIEELAQLNDRHPFSYDRDALVKMLDEALAAQAQ